jgi:hypothetical protein
VSDSAGQPWEGRRFADNPDASDDGSAPEAFVTALREFRSGRLSASDLLGAIATCRFLIPLVAVAGEEGVNDEGARIDKSQELSIITVAGPDGRPILPVFSSVAAMSAWRVDARPVPASAQRVALAAANEGTDRVVIDARGDEVVLPRPAVWAIATAERWVPALKDPDVVEAIVGPAEEFTEILAAAPVESDPELRGTGPEVLVRLAIAPGVEPERLREIITAITARWASDPLVARRVDALAVQPVILTGDEA